MPSTASAYLNSKAGRIDSTVDNVSCVVSPNLGTSVLEMVMTVCLADAGLLMAGFKQTRTGGLVEQRRN